VLCERYRTDSKRGDLMAEGSDTFVYSVVRFVPHPIRDEAINVGVVLVSPSGEHVLHRFTRAFRSRLSVLAPDVDPRMVERALSDFQARFPGDLAQAPLGSEARPLTEDALRQLSTSYGYQVRFTPPRPVAVEEPERSLAQLFDEYVGPITSGEAGGVPGRAKVRRRVLRRLRDWSVPRDRVIERPKIPVRHGSNTLDIGIERAANDLAVAVEPISFSISATEEIVRQRDHVAWVAADADRSASDFIICAVLGEPSVQNRDIFVESESLFRDVDVTPVPMSEIDQLRDVLANAGMA
jgi:hypothetical protein